MKLLTHSCISCPSYVFNSCDSIIVALFRLIAPHSGFEYEKLLMASVKTHLLVINDNVCCSNIACRCLNKSISYFLIGYRKVQICHRLCICEMNRQRINFPNINAKLTLTDHICVSFFIFSPHLMSINLVIPADNISSHHINTIHILKIKT